MQQPYQFQNQYQQQQQPPPQQPHYPPPPPPTQQQQPQPQQPQQPMYNPQMYQQNQQQQLMQQQQQQQQQQHQQYQQPQPQYQYQPQQQPQPQGYLPRGQQQPPQQPPQQPQQLPPQYQNQFHQPQYPQSTFQNNNKTTGATTNTTTGTRAPQNTHTPYAYATTRQPYIDPETKIIYPVTDIALSGWLTKQSDWLKDWRRRYFILTSNNSLFFCKNEYCAPHGRIDLSTCTTVKSADVKSRKKFSFEISTAERMYLLFADNEKEKDDWIGAVGKSIVRSSRTFLNQGGGAGGKGHKKGYSGDNGYGYGDDDDDDDSDYGGEGGVFENENNHPYFND